MVREAIGRKSNVHFVQTFVPERLSHLKRWYIMRVRTLSNIAREEELFVDYLTS